MTCDAAFCQTLGRWECLLKQFGNVPWFLECPGSALHPKVLTRSLVPPSLRLWSPSLPNPFVLLAFFLPGFHLLVHSFRLRYPLNRLFMSTVLLNTPLLNPLLLDLPLRDPPLLDPPLLDPSLGWNLKGYSLSSQGMA